MPDWGPAPGRFASLTLAWRGSDARSSLASRGFPWAGGTMEAGALHHGLAKVWVALETLASVGAAHREEAGSRPRRPSWQASPGAQAASGRSSSSGRFPPLSGRGTQHSPQLPDLPVCGAPAGSQEPRPGAAAGLSPRRAASPAGRRARPALPHRAAPASGRAPPRPTQPPRVPCTDPATAHREER